MARRSSSPIVFLALVVVCFTTKYVDAIVGGNEVVINTAYPYLVQIVVWPQNENNCVGSIINANNILTAASCVYGWFEKDLRVLVGSIDAKKGKVMEIKKYFTHPQYDAIGEGKANDIAVIRLKEAVTFSSKIRPIGLGTKKPAVNSKLTLFGWGAPNVEGSGYDGKLKKLKTEIQSSSNCEPEGFVYTVGDKQLCSLCDAGEGGCPGDYGSPLVIEGTQQGIFSRYGVTIYETQCGNGLPMVFTAIAPYNNWIQQQLKK